MEFSSVIFASGVFAPLACAAFISVGSPLISRKCAKVAALLGFGLSLISALYSLWAFSQGRGLSFDTLYFGGFSLNGVSLAMYLLAAVAGFAAAFHAIFVERVEKLRTYLTLLLFMQAGLMGMFAAENVFWMYAFHEFALVPTFIATCVWGGENKRQAAMEMAIYLTLGALVALIGVVALSFAASGVVVCSLPELRQMLQNSAISEGWQYWIFGLLALGLGTLVSLFPFHSWAPKAYTAAPTPFAMLHAGVLKKFGLYFLIQVALPFLGAGARQWSHLIMILALVNVIGIGLCTMAQTDLKKMISYSSVSHMGLCFLGIMSLSAVGVAGAVLLMFGHGLSVAALFALDSIIAGRFGTDSMRTLAGAYKKMPVCAGLFIAAILANIGLPGFANFWGELSVFVSLGGVNFGICALAVSGIVISAIYGLRAVAAIFYGPESEIVQASNARDISFIERLPAALLLLALLLVGFFPQLLTSALDATLSGVACINNISIK